MINLGVTIGHKLFWMAKFWAYGESELQCVKNIWSMFKRSLNSIYVDIYIGPLKYVGLWGNMLFFESVKFMTFKVPQAYV